MPFRLKTGRKGILVLRQRSRRYCLSYSVTFLYFLPLASVWLVVTVRDLPSLETTILPLVVRGFAVTGPTVYGNFHAVARGFVDEGVVLWRAWREL